MDTTTVVVVLVFVLSIISGVTGQKEQIVKNTTPIETKTQLVHKPTVDTIPGPYYDDGHKEDIKFAIIDFIRGYTSRVTTWDATLMASSIVKFSRQYNVNPRLVTALIARESSFNQFAVSSSGEQGLGQLLPATSQALKISDPFNIEENVYGTARYVRSCMDRFKGYSMQVPFALAGYLEGPNAVKRNNGYTAASSGYVDDILRLYHKI